MVTYIEPIFVLFTHPYGIVQFTFQLSLNYMSPTLQRSYLGIVDFYFFFKKNNLLHTQTA